MTTPDPQVYLAIDTCFAKKRWPMPEDWAPIVAAMGVAYVELSADTEADPMYHGAEYLAEWDQRVAEACARHGLKVSSLYSGHGSYSTIGLLHPDQRIVRRLMDRWVIPAIHRAAFHGADLGFFFHAIEEAALRDPVRYRHALEHLADRLGEAAGEGDRAGVRVSIEQMYTPNQPPWTIAGAHALMSDVMRGSGSPLYITLDTGHAWAQGRFAGAEPMDSDPYAWIREIGPYAPIVHLQQTDGRSSAHLPFTAETNATGIIHPERVLNALADGYRRSHPNYSPLPPRVESIYLTIEVFSGTAQPTDELIEGLTETVEYWRGAIPEDGLRLSELPGNRGA
jgi:sugar phosphate isomerase/epimerase